MDQRNTTSRDIPHTPSSAEILSSQQQLEPDLEHGEVGSQQFLRDFESGMQGLYSSTVIYSNTTSATVNLAALLRVQLHYLRRDLLQDAFTFKYGNKNSSSAIARNPRPLSTYITALKDYEYVQERARKGYIDDPFVATTDRLHDRIVLKETIRWWKQQRSETQSSQLLELSSHLDEICSSRSPIAVKSGILFGGSRTAANKKELFKKFLQRASMAFIGGIFLIGPMHIMVLHQSQRTNLVTTSVCVLAFGLLISVFLEKPFDVLSATAAYAAVLVVFVGTSMSTGSSSPASASA